MMKLKSLSPKAAARLAVDSLNRVIHANNLYSGHSRFINAHRVNGVLSVENLQTGAVVPFTNGQFRDGSGTPIFVPESDLVYVAPLTQATVKAELKSLGVSFKSLPETGEFKVGGSYFTNDLKDALDTGKAMAHAKKNPGIFVIS